MIWRILVISAAAFVLSGAKPVQPGSQFAGFSYESDPRYRKLQKYFQQRNCPAQDYTADFLAAADRHGIDWRLLPSIAMVESSGGKYARNNNILGWDNCRTRFESPRQGVHYVARRLAQSGLYRDRTLKEVLRRYNPRRAYGKRVQAFMAEFQMNHTVPLLPGAESK